MQPFFAILRNILTLFHQAATMKTTATTLFIVLAFIPLLFNACTEDKQGDGAQSSKQNMQKTTTVDFWNGNRSAARQIYERQVLKAILETTEEDWGAWELKESLEEYPGKEESLVFTEKNHDLFVTVAGNQKFAEGAMIVIPEPLTKNLLGYRIPIIRAADSTLFSEINEPEAIQKLAHGIPETWSDADIFRHNGYEVAEEGDFDDIFDRLQDNRFDYSAYGANEVLGVFKNRASKRKGLVIDQNILLFYPFPLVFYVNPKRPKMAERIEQGLQRIIASGQLTSIFNEHYGDITAQLKLNSRQVFILDNPLVPANFRALAPDLEKL